MQISKALSKKTIAITGSTGFLGTALVEKLLRSIPDCKLLLLVRPAKRGVERRVETEIFNNNAFATLKKELGSSKSAEGKPAKENPAFVEMLKSRVTSLASDITKENLGLSPKDLKLVAKADIFIHSAAAVSFSSQLDDAIETNLVGPLRILETLKASKARPHFVSVSTAYVVSSKRGLVAEKLLEDLEVSVNIESEIESARRASNSIEDESRRYPQLDKFQAEAKKDLGNAAGVSIITKRTEQLRRAWVKDQLVELGRTRANVLGFPDIYSLTKAMAETAMVKSHGEIPLSIVRPSIIESALAEPFPGWIRGFRMAEPIIISYARGLLKDFPAKPEGVLDIIPVDLVVSAICAVAATPPPVEPTVTNVASGATNPFRFSDLHDWCHNWFTLNPIYDENNIPISPPRWSYPSRTKVARQLKNTKWALQFSDTLIRKLPIRGKQAQSVARLEESIDKLERVEDYLELYGKYLECSSIFDSTQLFKLHKSLSPADQKTFAFDPNVIDWHDYLTEIHLPSVLIQGRVKTKPTSNTVARGSKRLREAVLSPERSLAIFDMENTFVASNVVSSWSWLGTRHLHGTERIKFIARGLAQAPKLLAMDRASREDFLQYFYKRYKGASVDELFTDSKEMFNDLILKKSFPAAVARIRKHQALGHKTLLITGALDFVVEPMRPLFDEIICAQMHAENGRYTGTLKSFSPTGELRAEILHSYAAKNGLELSNSVAYADSVSDLALLEAVGFPVVVNPEIKLASIARRRGWLIENFSKSHKYDSKLLPTAPKR